MPLTAPVTLSPSFWSPSSAADAVDVSLIVLSSGR